jgi:hypothetical protein
MFPVKYRLNSCILELINFIQTDSCVEAGSITSTVALRVVGGDENRTQCLGVQPGHPVTDGYKYGDLALQVGGLESETIKYAHEGRGTRT